MKCVSTSTSIVVVTDPELLQLTHNVHGPHDEKFYRMLSELEAEYDSLKRSGYSGEGFHSKGNRVGVGISHNIPPSQARSRAAEAAAKRKSVAGVMGAGGQRLGGPSTTGFRTLGPRELAAKVNAHTFFAWQTTDWSPSGGRTKETRRKVLRNSRCRSSSSRSR